MTAQPPASGSKTPSVLFSLPGFLGYPSDWNGIIPETNEQWDHVPVNYYDKSLAPPMAGLRVWADTFNRSIAKDVYAAAEQRYLLGYSLGGRLALHALCRQPHLWNGVIFVSTHPGISSEECAVRIHSDEVWAERFEHEPLEQVLQAWNAQALFDKTPFPGPRLSDQYDRTLIAATLRGWSLGRQQDFTPQIAKLPIPILWIVGERDHRFCALTERLTFGHPLSCVAIVPDAGHRVPWQQPELFQTLLTDFFHQIELEPSHL